MRQFLDAKQMTAKVRELIDDVVWKTEEDTVGNVLKEMGRILRDHVAPMIGEERALADLEKWAIEQRKMHKAKASKIDTNVRGCDSSGLEKLYNHHWRIHNRYNCVAIAICSRRMRIQMDKF
jgi:hypothetical protein